MWLMADGITDPRRGHGTLGGAAPFYRCYQCADGRWIAVGAIEPQFWALLMDLIAAPADLRARQYDKASWPQSAAELAADLPKGQAIRPLQG